MQLDLYLKVSVQLNQLAHTLDQIYFDTRSLLPKAIDHKDTQTLLLELTHHKDRLDQCIQTRQTIFKTILSVLAEGNNELPPAFQTLISHQIQQWHDNQASYLATIRRLPTHLIRRNPDLLKLITMTCNEITAEDSSGLRGLGLTIGTILFKRHGPYFRAQAKRYQAGDLIQNRSFLFALMHYQAHPELNLKFNDVVKYLVWYHTKVLPRHVQVISARDVLPQAGETGLAADALILTFTKTTEVFFVIKGTEFHRDPTLARFKRLNKALTEAYRDWRYNVEAILLGENTARSQINVTRDFITYVRGQVSDDTAFYGVGHSLGGHLVQALQLIYRPFTKGYTLNSAPVQLRQIYKLAPELFPIETWDKLLMTTLNGGFYATDPAYLESILGYDQYPITNEGFAQDFIQVFYNMHFNVFVGRFNRVYKPELDYKFVPEIAQYLNSEEINFAAFTMGEFFKQTSDTDENQSLQLQILQFMRNWGKPPHLSPAKRQQFTKDYNRYLIACGILKPTAPKTPTHLPRLMTKHLSSGKIATARRLQPELCELLVYFHVVSGAQFFFST